MIKYALKDNILAEGKIAQAASNVLKGYKSPFSSTIVKLLDDKFLHVNMDEFGMGSFGVHSAYGPVSLNGKVAGGSSSGCAAAVKQDYCEVGIGTDTGGSIRLPAAFCELIGFKPSYGRISRYGVITYAQSLDTVGLLSKSLSKIQSTFQLLDKYDPNDHTSIATKFRSTRSAARKKLKIGIPKNIDNRVFRKASLEFAAKQNIDLIDVELPYFDFGLACYYIISTAEAFSALNRYTGLLYPEVEHSRTFEQQTNATRARFGIEVKNRLELGSFVLNNHEFDAWFLQAAKIRRLIQNDYTKAFTLVDYILMPTTLQTPPLVKDVLDPKIEDYESDSFTVGPSLAGLPTLSFPFDQMSFQISGPHLSDYQLLWDYDNHCTSE